MRTHSSTHPCVADLIRLALGACLATVALASTASSQSLPEPLWVLDSLRSEVLGELRIVRIGLPQDYTRSHRAAERFPVLVVLDGTGPVFDATVASARALADYATPAIPPLIVVGVETVRNRYANLTPPQTDGPLKGEQGAGGAPKFARFLETELLPFVAARYRTLPFTIVAGHSLSGLFTAYTYGQSPQLVDAAIATSPSLHWNAGVAARQVLDGIRTRSTPGRLFVAAGANELMLDSAAAHLEAELARRPGPTTAFERRRLADDTHYTARLQGMIDGLRFVFLPVSLSTNTIHGLDRDDKMAAPETMLAAYHAIRREYVAGARKLGLPERLPPTFGGVISHWLSSSGRAAAGIEICKDVVETHPDIWIGYDCLGYAQSRSGDETSAAASYKKGLELARRAGDQITVARLEAALQALSSRH